MVSHDPNEIYGPEAYGSDRWVQPGSVTILALVNDPDHLVELYIDPEIWNAKQIHCHPLVNTETLVLSHDALARFLGITRQQFKLIN